MSTDEMLAGVDALIPKVRQLAPETAETGRIPDDVISALKELGYFRIFRPVRLHGIAAPWGTQIEAARRLARVCGSTGWIAAVIPTHNILAARFPKAAQDEVWASEDDVIIATGSARLEGSAKAVEDGYVVEGAWRFASGVDHAAWTIVPVPLDGAQTKDRSNLKQVLIRRRDFDIVDDWNVIGLEGTGSKRVVVPKPILVPEHRIVGFHALHAADPPGADADGDPIFRIDFQPYFGTILLGPVIGAAEGAVADYLSVTRERVGAIFGNRIAEAAPVQLRLAESAAEVDAAALVVERLVSQHRECAEDGKGLSTDQRIRSMRDRAWVTLRCVDAVHRLVRQMGAGGLSVYNPVQRHFRDITAMAAQIGLNWDRNGGAYGAWALGMPTGDPTIDNPIP